MESSEGDLGSDTTTKWQVVWEREFDACSYNLILDRKTNIFYCDMLPLVAEGDLNFDLVVLDCEEFVFPPLEKNRQWQLQRATSFYRFVKIDACSYKKAIRKCPVPETDRASFKDVKTTKVDD